MINEQKEISFLRYPNGHICGPIRRVEAQVLVNIYKARLFNCEILDDSEVDTYDCDVCGKLYYTGNVVIHRDIPHREDMVF